MAKRETDTMPNWAGSDWYFLRYCDPFNKERIAEIETLRKWMPVDVYVGGDEHNTSPFAVFTVYLSIPA